MDEVVDAVSNNIRIIFSMFFKLSHDPRSSLSPLQVPQKRPASVNRRAFGNQTLISCRCSTGQAISIDHRGQNLGKVLDQEVLPRAGLSWAGVVDVDIETVGPTHTIPRD